MSRNERTFSKEEAQRIYADAPERHQAYTRHAHEHLTFDGLEEAAVAAGIEALSARGVDPLHD